MIHCIVACYISKSNLDFSDQNVEIAELRSSTLETFGWLEEARSREGTAEDCKYLQLLRWDVVSPGRQPAQIEQCSCLMKKFQGLIISIWYPQLTNYVIQPKIFAQQKMLRARPLDPRSQRQLANLRAQFLYCEQQVLFPVESSWWRLWYSSSQLQCKVWVMITHTGGGGK